MNIQHPQTSADALLKRAELAYPGNASLQDEWRRAVGIVRGTTKGWLVERHVQRKDAACSSIT